MNVPGAMAKLGLAITEEELARRLKGYTGPEPPAEIRDAYWRDVWKALVGARARLRGGAWCYEDGGPIPGLPELDRRAYAADPTTHVPEAYADGGEPDADDIARELMRQDPTWGTSPNTAAWAQRKRLEGTG